MRHSLYLAASLAALAAAAPRAHAEAPFDFDHTPGKLPKIVVPETYQIDITPNLDTLALTGTESIAIDVRQPTDSITLNQAGLKLASATLEDGAAATITLNEKAQTATLTFAKPVAAGAHTLKIAYSGPIPATPNGIYYDDYKTASGAKKRMLVTQFEVADARRMFPGWDEPAFKAKFQLSVTLPKDLAVVSNMPAASTTAVGSDKKHIVFAQSPRMSTYLLALVAGDMAALDGHAAGSGDACLGANRRAGPGAVRARCRAERAALLQHLFRRGVSAAEARPDCRSRQLRGGARWRIGAPSRSSTTRCCSIPRRPHPRPRRKSTWWWRMRWRTNGRAISSPWAGGTISG